MASGTEPADSPIQSQLKATTLKDLLEAPEIETTERPATILIPGRPKRRNTAALIAAVLVVIAISALVLWRKAGRAQTALNPNVSTAVVKREDFVRNLRITGTVEAVNF